MPGVNINLPCTAYTGNNPFAFISYAHLDANTAYPEIRRLDLMGYRVWYDEGIDPGNEWPEEVAKALSKCTQFIVYVTTRSINSRNVRNEINYALKLNKPFLAIHLEETFLPGGMDLQMSSIQARLKWQMNEQTYLRNLNKVLPHLLDTMVKNEPFKDGSVEDELVELFARTLFSEEQNRMGNPDRKNWHQLDSFVKVQIIARSYFLLSMLHIAGYNICTAQDFDNPIAFTAEILDLLVQMEHYCISRKD